MIMNKNQKCQENFLKIQQGCNKKKKIKLVQKKVKHMYNKNKGCLETIGGRYKKKIKVAWKKLNKGITKLRLFGKKKR